MRFALNPDQDIDPYSWLKDENWRAVLDNPDLLRPDIRDYLEYQNKRFDEYSADFSYIEERIYRNILNRTPPKKISLITRDDRFAYFSISSVDAKFPVICRSQYNDTQIYVMLDGNISERHRHIGHVTHNSVHSILAFSIHKTGSENGLLRFFDMNTMTDMNTEIMDICGEFVWSADGRAIYYTRGDDRHVAKDVYRHVIGTDPNDDILVYHENDEEHVVKIKPSQSGRYIFIQSFQGKSCRAYALDQSCEKPPQPRIILTDFCTLFDIDHTCDYFYFLASRTPQAPKAIWKKASLDDEFLSPVLPVPDDMHITDMTCTGHGVLYSYLHRSFPGMGFIDAGGVCHDMQFPHPLFYAQPQPIKNKTCHHIEFDYQTPTSAISKMVYSIQNNAVISHNNENSALVSKRHFAQGRDGTDIPVTVVYHKDKRVEHGPLFMYAYGAYGDALPHAYLEDPVLMGMATNPIDLVNHGVTVALVHVRGGSDMGHQWHDQGKLMNKKNSFYDFLDAAHDLTDHGYGQKGKIFIEGASAGGLLIGSVLNMEPELFCGAIAEVPFIDVINSMSDPTLPWVSEERSEWGDPTDTEQHAYMRSYSPYDTIRRDLRYPPVLAIAGLTDSLVMYWEPAKWIARLTDSAQGGPFLLKTHMNAGHDGPQDTLTYFRNNARCTAFALTCFKRAGFDGLVPC